MKQKLPTVKDALLDLSLSLNARRGENRFSVFVFPGKKKEVEKLLDWTPRLVINGNISKVNDWWNYTNWTCH